MKDSSASPSVTIGREALDLPQVKRTTKHRQDLTRIHLHFNRLALVRECRVVSSVGTGHHGSCRGRKERSQRREPQSVRGGRVVILLP